MRWHIKWPCLNQDNVRVKGAAINNYFGATGHKRSLSRQTRTSDHPVYTWFFPCRSLGRQLFILQSELQTRHLSIWWTSLYKTGTVLVFSECALWVDINSPLGSLDQDSAIFFCKEPDTIIGFVGHEVSVTAIQCCHHSVKTAMISM